MMSAQEQYVDTVIEKFGGYVPVWYPNQAIAVGDVLAFDSAGSLQKIGDLGSFGVAYKVITGIISAPINFQSSSKLTINFKAAGGLNSSVPAVPAASAGISIDFSDEGDFVMQADAATEDTIDNLLQVEAQLQSLLDSGKWHNNYLVAGKVLKTNVFSLIISDTNSSNVQISLTLPAGTMPVLSDLASASANMALATGNSSTTTIAAVKNTTPLVAPLRLVPQVWPPGSKRTLKYVTS